MSCEGCVCDICEVEDIWMMIQSTRTEAICPWIAYCEECWTFAGECGLE